MGDFNTETSYRTARDEHTYGADLLRTITDTLSWTDLAVRHGDAAATFARKDGRTARIDYAFASPSLATRCIEFASPTTIGHHHLVGEPSSRPLSDHTPVLVDIGVRSENGPQRLEVAQA
jgi:endonuclease/exonuclease/phosphatase family metal-dependent hydrolase